LIFLDSLQQKQVYVASLQECGYIRLEDTVLAIWRKLVERGLHTLLPGDLGRILQRLRYQPSGIHMPGAAFYSRLRKFLGHPIWLELTKLTGGMEFSQANIIPWTDALYYICDYTGLGVGELFHWGGLEEFRAMDDCFQFDFPEDRLTADILYQNRNTLQQTERGLKPFSYAERVRFHHPELISDSYIHALHSFWNERHLDLRARLGSVPPLEEKSSNDLMYAEPEYQTFGGYNDIEMKGEGNWSALLSSELVYMEGTKDPDYFDVRYLESQLMYYKQDEGLNRKLRRRIVCDLSDVDLVLPSHTGRYMAWAEYLLLIIHDLFSKDRLKIELHLSDVDEQHSSRIRQLLYLRLKNLRPDYYWDISFTPLVTKDEEPWLESSVICGIKSDDSMRIYGLENPESRMGLKQKSPDYQLKRALMYLADIEAFFRGE